MSVSRNKPHEARQCTAIHEAGHAVLSYLVGKRVKHAVLFNDRSGEVVPECGVCDTLVRYYKSFDGPADAVLWKQVEDELRRDIVIAIAGGVSEKEICGNESVYESEIRRDKNLSKNRASIIHYRRNKQCWRAISSREPCSVCDDYIDLMNRKVKEILWQVPIKNAIERLAEKLEALENYQRIDEFAITEFLEGMGLVQGSSFELLPAHPVDIMQRPSS